MSRILSLPAMLLLGFLPAAAGVASSAERIAFRSVPPPESTPAESRELDFARRARLDSYRNKPGRPAPRPADSPLSRAAALGSLCDVAWHLPGGWYVPVIPYDTSAHGGDGGAPPLLRGDLAATDLAFGTRNTQPFAGPGFDLSAMVDGSPHALPSEQGLAGLETRIAARALGAPVPGGRHTLGIWFDPANGVAEADEGNNEWAAQWVWAPQSLTMGVPLVRPGVPEPTGGHDAIPPGTTPYPNRDGVRSPDFHGDGNDGYWGLVGIVPLSAADDVDLALFTPTPGPIDGFGVPLRSATDLAGATDLILVDADPALGLGGVTGPRDIGASLVTGTPAASFAVECEQSAWIGFSAGTHGPVTMGAGQFIRLFEFFFDGADRHVVLQNLTGQADLAMAVVRRVPGHGGLYARPEFLTLGVDCDAEGAGGDERAVLTGRPAAYYAIAVWKVGAGDFGDTVSFRLHITDGLTGVSDAAAPIATSFRGAIPNPARPGGTLAFELARDSRVELSIHDLSGRRVATVASGSFAPGRHAPRWDGRDARGNELPGGLYFARFEGGGVRASRKLALVR
ncbi:MAG: hypothetical protein IT348_14630 [Candidatus Eisenbacteria bacterium]|nr:hypothetical protein [Candidatus Eisenbacteria bacterium]